PTTHKHRTCDRERVIDRRIRLDRERFGESERGITGNRIDCTVRARNCKRFLYGNTYLVPFSGHDTSPICWIIPRGIIPAPGPHYRREEFPIVEAFDCRSNPLGLESPGR